MRRKYKHFGYQLINAKICSCNRRSKEIYKEFNLNCMFGRIMSKISSLRIVCKHCFISKVAETDNSYLRFQSNCFEKQNIRFIVHILDVSKPTWLCTETADTYFNNKNML
mgnify:CR=1 FL=1